jgi:rare lipoprotein A
MRRLLAIALTLGLAACAGAPKKSASPPPSSSNAGKPHSGTTSAAKKSPYAPAQEDPGKRGDYVAGGLYAPNVRDSVPDDIPDVDAIPEPEVTAEPRSKVGNRKTYSVLGRKYEVLDSAQGYAETGVASFYGKKFHGRRTSNLEVYDMYAFSAAHKTLPLPSFVRVTNLDNGKSVIVRVNDRGPFHSGRIIDLSYAAATKLGYVRQGTARVEVRALTPDDAQSVYASRKADSPKPQPPTPAKALGAAQSPMDRLVASVPTGLADKPGPGVAEEVSGEYRFDMRQDGKAMTAAEFDAWMKSRQVRIATGKPGKPQPATARDVAPVATGHATPASAPSASRETAVKSGEHVVLQVASFAARANADRALAMLQTAGIATAALTDGDANGQKVWRLRVGPLGLEAASDLASRIAGLGFGTPQRVRE